MGFVTLLLDTPASSGLAFQFTDGKLTLARLRSIVFLTARLPATQAMALSYVDDEGDVIAVSCDKDVEELFHLAGAMAPAQVKVTLGDKAATAAATPAPAPAVAPAPPTPTPPTTTTTTPTPTLRRAPSLDPASWTADLTFYLNGAPVTVTNPDPRMHLVEYIRDVAMLKGTKIGCGEGGCGACTVVLSWQDATSGKTKYEPINSCLRPLASCAGYNVITAEGIRPSRGEYHPVQTALANNNGSQCGFCSVGWTMKAYTLLADTPSPSKLQVDNSFDGNLCRCTGVFPILNAYKTFSPSDPAPAAGEEESKAGCTGSCSTCPAAPTCHAHDVEDLGAALAASGSSSTASSSSSTCASDGTPGVCASHGKPGTAPCASHGSPGACASAEKVDPLPPPMPLPDALKGFTPTPLRFVHFVGGTAVEWYSPTSLADLTALQSKYMSSPAGTVKYVGGNTGYGVEKYYNGSSPATPTPYTVYIDVTRVPELTATTVDDNSFTVGAATPLADVIALCAAQDPMAPTSTNDPTTEAVLTATSTYSALARHLLLVANHQVRSVGSWAGNVLMAAHNKGFPSDVALVLMTIGATCTVVQAGATQNNVPIEQIFHLSTNTAATILVNMTIPKLAGITASTPGPHVIDTFKAMLRHQNSHALVNAGFLLTLSGTDAATATVTGARVFYGGVGKELFRADTVEKLLTGAPLTQGTLTACQGGLTTDINNTGAATYWGTTDEYRRSVAASFLYKLFVRAAPAASVASTATSAGARYIRPVSTESASYKPNPSEAPVSDPIIKLSALKQTSGEATYVYDTKVGSDGLNGALAVTNVAFGTITKIDTTAAEAMEGVRRVLSVADIPAGGSNDVGANPGQEKLFLAVGDEIGAQGQSVALVLADTFENAYAASLAVVVETGAATTEPVFTIKDAIAKSSFFSNGTPAITKGDAVSAIAAAKHQLSGTLELGGAKHFYMEVQNAEARMEDGDILHLSASTQSSGLDQATAQKITGLPSNKTVAHSRRSGGGFGGKGTRQTPVVAAAALAAYVTGLHVHVKLERGQDLRMTGGRENMYAEWSVGFDDAGVLAGYTLHMYTNGGCFMDGGDGDLQMAMLWSDNAYFFPTYSCLGTVCRTNRPAVTSMRAPGVPQSLFIIETVMDKIAASLSMDPLTVRQSNFLRIGETTPYNQPIDYLSLPTVWQQLMDECQYDTAKAAADAFNKANRWRKRGVALTPLKYGIVFEGYNAQTVVRVYADASIEVTTSGSEIGQGLYTKVAQAVAYELKAPLASIVVTPSSTLSSPYVTVSGGSGTSEACVKSALMACDVLNTRLADVRKDKPSGTWADIVAEGYNQLVDMTAEALFSPTTTPSGGFFDYYVYAAAFSEVEIDVLTGEPEVLKSHMVYDCGTSLNPDIDVGQIEGAFMMGAGYFLSEDLVFSDTTGKLLSTGTWEYKPPFPLDIPQEFKLFLLDDVPNPVGILKSKATGEPALALANTIHFAAKAAVASARADAGASADFVLPVPATPCAIATACATTIDAMTL